MLQNKSDFLPLWKCVTTLILRHSNIKHQQALEDLKEDYLF